MLLGRIPIEKMGRCGVRFNIFYTDNGKNNPSKQILFTIFEQIKYVEFVERTPSRQEKWLWKKMVSASGRFERVWPLPFKNSGHHRIQRKGKNGKWRVIIQTHLDGHKNKDIVAKKWNIENWIKFIQELEKMGCEVGLLEWDPSAREIIIRNCPFVIDCSSGKLGEICETVRQFDCLVSVDSWTKYAAAWANLRQVIIVPDLRRGYVASFESISADMVAKWWFHGLMNNSRIKVIGLFVSNGVYEYGLKSINDLSVDQLLTATRQLLTVSA